MDSFVRGSSFVRSTFIHGGVSILVHSKIHLQDIPDIAKKSKEKDCDMVAIYIKSNNTVVITSYRSPNSTVPIFLETISEALSTKLNPSNPKTTVIRTGDCSIDRANEKQKKETCSIP